jgi:hypothetical protein
MFFQMQDGIEAVPALHKVGMVNPEPQASLILNKTSVNTIQTTTTVSCSNPQNCFFLDDSSTGFGIQEMTHLTVQLQFYRTNDNCIENHAGSYFREKQQKRQILIVFQIS